LTTTILATLALAAAATVPATAAATAPASAGASAQRAGCAGQNDASAPAAVQERAMLCLVNRARRGLALPPLASVTSLNRAADRKSGDILRCDEFSHEACGRDFTYWMSRFGYSFCAGGENIAWGSGSLGTPRSIFRSWMRSTGHRRNILGAYEDIGIGLRVGNLEGYGGAHVWTQVFGSRGC
jgi:uncharacterized protein YkwD